MRRAKGAAAVALRSVAGLLFGVALALLHGCGLDVLAEHIIPPRRGDPEPFVAIRQYLDSIPPVSRALVVRRQGEPDFTRRNGSVLFYVAAQELGDVPFDAPRTYQSHILVVELDSNGRVQRHDAIVGSSCTHSGICIELSPGLARPGNPWKSAATYRQNVLEGLRTYEKTADPVDGLAQEAGADRCLVFAWLSHSRDSDVWIQFGDHGVRKVIGPRASNFVDAALDPGTIRVAIEWSENATALGWGEKTLEEGVEIDCRAGARKFMQFDLTPTKSHARGVVAGATLVSEEIAREALAARMREME